MSRSKPFQAHSFLSRAKPFHVIPPLSTARAVNDSFTDTEGDGFITPVIELFTPSGKRKGGPHFDGFSGEAAVSECCTEPS
jgi:hypothetical protein